MKKYLLPLAVLPFAVIAIVFYLHKDTVEAATTIHPNDIFANYATWRETWPMDAPPVLSALATYPDTIYSATPNKFTFIDINGDNLPDFLYHEKTGGSNNNSQGPKYYAIFLNNGNNNFNLAFKCVTKYMGPGSFYNYGDCGGTQLTDPNAPENQNMLSQVLTLANYYNANSTPKEQYPYTHLWIDINGDGLQDLVDTALHINNNQSSPHPLYF